MMMRYFRILFLLIFCLLFTSGFGQISPFEDVVLRADTTIVKYSILSGAFKDHFTIPFHYRTEKQEVALLFKSNNLETIKHVLVSSSPTIHIHAVDRIANEGYMVYAHLEDITQANFFKLFIQTITSYGDTIYGGLELQPVAGMNVSLVTPPEEVFVGEEVMYELNVNMPDNILIRSDWILKSDYQYKIIRSDGRIFLQFISLTTGRYPISIVCSIIKPVINTTGSLSYTYTFDIPPVPTKAGRMAFLATDVRDMIMDNDSRQKGIEIQLENNHRLEIGKTYRIEAQEEPGGALIAELFVKTRMANNRVLALVRPFNLHASSTGYLYIKEGDLPRFITNFSVIPQTTIRTVSVLREGREWSTQLRVNPSETAIVRIEGESISKARFSFDIPGNTVFDTLVLNDKEAEFRVHVPLNVPKTRLDMLMNGKSSGYSLSVAEYQRPRPLDFITIDYGRGNTPLNYITGPVFYQATIKDIRIAFDPDILDEQERLFGKQYLTIEIRIHGSRGELLESIKLDNVVVCPSETSPRYAYYPKKDCRFQEIMVNQYLSRKTYSWEIWTRAVITISHTADKYTSEVHRKTIELILERPVRFDVDVSFPAGLLIVRPGEQQLGNLSGISMAMVAQFSFYYKDQIAKAKPFKVGAGFLALNAFNFSESNTNRDMGVVLIGSIFPTRRDVKMSFPLYVGTGYFLNQKQWFFLLGPGIRVNF